MPHSAALIADVKGSRQIENWPEVFEVLKKTLREANKRFADQILVKFAPTVGDEFQGALKSPEMAYDVYTFIKASLHVPIYGGLGIGEVEIMANGSAGLRGTAFYRAREALETCKAERGLLRVRSQNQESHLDRILNVILLLAESHEKGWTDRQREVASLHRLHPGETLEKLGERLGVSQSSITQVLNVARFGEIQQAETAIRSILETRDLGFSLPTK
jgi:hypothetical protein